MTTCQCQKPLVNAHGCCGYCGKGVGINAVQPSLACDHCGQRADRDNSCIITHRGKKVLLHLDCQVPFEKGQAMERSMSDEWIVSGMSASQVTPQDMKVQVIEMGVDPAKVGGGGTVFYKVHPIEFSEADKAAIAAELAKVKSHDFLLIPHTVDTESLEHATARWRDCLEVIEQTYKRHPNGVGVPQESIRGNALYVLDWRPDEPKRMSAVKVEHVVTVDRVEDLASGAVTDGTVNMVGSVTDLETFASLVVGGPFPLDAMENDE